MIIYTKQGNRQTLPLLFAYDEGVYCFEFYGDETFTDTYDSSTWLWVGTDLSIEETLGVSQDDGRNLFKTQSLSDCKSLAGSFFWDDANGVLYVHWHDSVGDWSISRDASSFSAIGAGYASGYNHTSKNVFDGIFYDSIITSIGGLNKKVDPTKFGLISFSDSSFSLSNEDGQFDNLEESQVVGVPIWFYFVEDDATELINDDRVFTGYLNGYTNNLQDVTFKIIETRFFENKPTCPNSMTLADYPNCGDKEGKTLPTAWGEIRKGICLPTNNGSLTDAASGTATLLVADPSLYAVKAINKLYNQDDVEVTITATDLTACTVSFTKPAGDSVGDLEKYRWEGEGYDISGTYNNGLDIIRAAFLSLANVPYLVSTYNIPEYAQAIIDNPQSIGLSLKTDKGFIEEIIEPITTSLQGIVDIQGDGRITWRSRDITQPVKDTVYLYDQIADSKIDVSPKETVSEITATYSPDFTDNKKFLTSVYSDDKPSVIGNYGINRKDPLSPVETVLVDEADVQTTLIEIMETSSSPIESVSTTSVEFLDVDLFDIIGIDKGRYGSENIIYGEILNINPNYLNETQTINIRTIENPVFAPLHNDGVILKDFILKDKIMGPPAN